MFGVHVVLGCAGLALRWRTSLRVGQRAFRRSFWPTFALAGGARASGSQVSQTLQAA
jgi:hypothetical protein